MEGTFRRDVRARRVPLHVRADARCGEALRICVSDDAGHQTDVVWAGPLQAAEKHPLTVELLRRQFGRLGDTPFELATSELLGPHGPTESCPVMVQQSVLNDLRRQAVRSLLDQRTAARRHAVVEPAALEQIHAEGSQYFAEPADDQPSNAVDGTGLRMHVLVRTLEQFDAVLGWEQPTAAVARGLLYADFRHAGDYDRVAAAGHASAWSLGLATPRILLPGEEPDLARLADRAPRAVLVRNLGSLSFLRRHCPQLELIGDHSLNIAN